MHKEEAIVRISLTPEETANLLAHLDRQIDISTEHGNITFWKGIRSKIANSFTLEPIEPDAVYGVWSGDSDLFVFDTVRLGKHIAGWDYALKYDETTNIYVNTKRKDLPPEVIERARRK